MPILYDVSLWYTWVQQREMDNKLTGAYVSDRSVSRITQTSVTAFCVLTYLFTGIIMDTLIYI